MTQRQSIHGEWSSRWAFILAATAAAVGLGNIWKFPYVTGQNGGGAFVLVYLFCILILGIPLLIAEITIGRSGRQNPANSVKTLALEANRSKHWGLVGGLTILAGALILSYYSVIAGWALAYVVKSMAGAFDGITVQGSNDLFNHFIDNPLSLTLWHSLIMLITVLVITRGLEKGIERAVRFMFPIMMLLILILVIYGMNSGHFYESLVYLFKPDLSELTPNAILAAMGQAFFTLSVATGSIMMYGAYLPRNASVTHAATAIAIADTAVALLAGLAIFPIVFANQLEPSSGPGLIFQTLPLAFSLMPFGKLFATLFFIMLVFAALTSAISLLEPSVAWLVERKHITRPRATIIAGSLVWLMGFGTIFAFNGWRDYRIFGLNFFELLDYLTANLMLPIGGLLIAIFTGWMLQRSTLLEETQLTDKILFKVWCFLLRYISPILIMIVFLKAIKMI